jgi:hypothetical protein
MYLKKIGTTLIIKWKWKRRWYYMTFTYPEYLHVSNRYYKNPTSFKCFKIIVL